MNRKTATYLCCFILMVFALNFTMISPLLPAISKSFSLSMTETGALFTAEFAGFIAFIFIGGFLAGRIGKKRVITVAIFGLAISVLLFAAADDFTPALIIMVFVGGFGGMIESITTAMVFDLNEVNRSYYVNLSQIFFGVGAVVGPLVAGLIVMNEISWKVCYYMLSAVIFIMAGIFAVSEIPTLVQNEPVSLKDLRNVAKSKKFLAVCLCMVLYTGSEVGGWGWLSMLLKENMGFSIAGASLAVSVFWISMTLGRFICGLLSLRYKLRSMIIALAVLSSIVTAMAVFVHSEILAWIVITAMGLTYSSQFPFIVDYGIKNSAAASGIAVSLLMGSGSVGSMVVPYFMGIAGDCFGLRISMVISAFLLMCVAIIFTGFGSRMEKGKNGK